MPTLHPRYFRRFNTQRSQILDLYAGGTTLKIELYDLEDRGVKHILDKLNVSIPQQPKPQNYTISVHGNEQICALLNRLPLWRHAYDGRCNIDGPTPSQQICVKNLWQDGGLSYSVQGLWVSDSNPDLGVDVSRRMQVGKTGSRQVLSCRPRCLSNDVASALPSSSRTKSFTFGRGHLPYDLAELKGLGAFLVSFSCRVVSCRVVSFRFVPFRFVPSPASPLFLLPSSCNQSLSQATSCSPCSVLYAVGCPIPSTSIKRLRHGY